MRKSLHLAIAHIKQASQNIGELHVNQRMFFLLMKMMIMQLDLTSEYIARVCAVK